VRNVDDDEATTTTSATAVHNADDDMASTTTSTTIHHTVTHPTTTVQHTTSTTTFADNPFTMHPAASTAVHPDANPSTTSRSTLQLDRPQHPDKVTIATADPRNHKPEHQVYPMH
jgi:hypothetical protein